MTEALRVILVSDDDDDRALACMVIRQSYEDVELLEATDALTFADHLADGEFDVALSAPENRWANGVDVLAAIKRRQPNCATILFGEPLPEAIDSKVVDVALRQSSRGFLQLPQAIEQARDKLIALQNAPAPDVAYERLVANLPLAVFQLDQQAGFIDANPTTLKVLGHSEASQLIGKRLTDLFVDIDFRMKCRALMDRSQSLSDLETTLRRADGGTVPVRLSFWPVTPNSGRPAHFEGVMWDVSALAQSAELTAAAISSDELAAVLSHDLQDPLQVIAQYARLLKDRHGAFLNEDATKLLVRMSDSAARMQSMIDGIVEFSTIASGERPFQVVDMQRLMADVMDNLELVVKRSEAIVEYQQLASVVGEPRQLLQLLQNLISNAIKYRSERPVNVTVSVTERDNDWLLSVADNGIGLSADSTERVFGMFQRLHTDEEIPGRGVGLAVCKRIAQCHGGRIWVESTVGQGSTFFVTIAKDVQSRLPNRERKHGTG